MRSINYLQALLALGAAGTLAAPPPLREIVFADNSCKDGQKAFLKNAFQEGLQLVNNALNTMTPDSIPFKTFFQPKPNDEEVMKLLQLDPNKNHVFSVVKGVLTQIQTAITDKNDKLSITCDSQSEACTKTGKTLAHAILETRQVNFCARFFTGEPTEPDNVRLLSDVKCVKDSSGKSSIDFKSAHVGGPQEIDDMVWIGGLTVVHEIAHLMDTTSRRIPVIRDCYYMPFAAEFMAYHAPRAALGNADNYAWFALAQYLNTLCNHDMVDKQYYRAWWYNNDFPAQLREQQDSLAKIKASTAKVKADLAHFETYKEDMAKRGITFGSDGRASKVNASKGDQAMVDGWNDTLPVYQQNLKMLDEQVKKEQYFEEQACNDVGDISWQGVLDIMNKRPQPPTQAEADVHKD